MNTPTVPAPCYRLDHDTVIKARDAVADALYLLLAHERPDSYAGYYRSVAMERANNLAAGLSSWEDGDSLEQDVRACLRVHVPIAHESPIYERAVEAVIAAWAGVTGRQR